MNNNKFEDLKTLRKATVEKVARKKIIAAVKEAFSQVLRDLGYGSRFLGFIIRLSEEDHRRIFGLYEYYAKSYSCDDAIEASILKIAKDDGKIVDDLSEIIDRAQNFVYRYGAEKKTDDEDC